MDKKWWYVCAVAVAAHLAFGYSPTVVLWEQKRHRNSARPA